MDELFTQHPCASMCPTCGYLVEPCSARSFPDYEMDELITEYEFVCFNCGNEFTRVVGHPEEAS